MKLQQRIALYLLPYITVCYITYAQDVEIPDSNLRSVVAESLGANPDRITRVDMRRLERIDAVYKEIESLEGLQHAPNLRLLDLDGNRISDLTPLVNLTSLEELGLDRNRVSDISPLAGLINLQVLTTDENRTSDLTPLANLRNLEELVIDRNDITDISPLLGLTNLRILTMFSNGISDLTPLANLTNLEELLLHGNRITDISPLGRLTNLRILKMSSNGISDLTPLANLTNLEQLELDRNRITDISPLAGLTNLKVLKIEDNLIIDHSILGHLSIEKLYYDQTCEFPPEPLAPRLENRSFPSIFGPFTYDSPYDLIVVGIGTYYDYFFNADGKWQLRVKGSVTESVNYRDDELLAYNPNTITIAEIRMRDEGGGYPPPHSPDWVWVHDHQGNVYYDGERRLINFTHPLVQDMIVEQAVAVSKCGLYDGIFLDWWNKFDHVLGDANHIPFIDNATQQQARDSIMRRIRSNVRPDFLVMGNMNRRTAPRNAPHINGSFMETITPSDHDAETAELLFSEIADSLQWLESNLREPRINALEGLRIPFENAESPENLRWMRAFTTLSLTFSDGYVAFVEKGHGQHWYDFWDTDLGQPVGAKSQTYNNVEGLYIREFTNGWAVHNHSGEPQIITLPEEVQGVASGHLDAEHALGNIDGEMYLRVKPKNPADINGDGVVNILDLTLVAQALGTEDANVDINGDGVVNVFDLVFVANAF